MQNNVNKGSGFSAKILAMIDGVIQVSYTSEACLFNEVYSLDSEVIGYVSSIEATYVEVIMIKDIKLELSDIVYISLTPISVTFNNNILGSIVNPLGESVMHFTIKENFYNQGSVKIFDEAPNINKRKSIDNQFLTGHNVIDILFPVGYGQRMMVIGDSKVYKTHYIIQIIKTVLMNRKAIKRDEKTIFIYASIGQRLNHLKEVLDYLVNNVVGNTLIIGAQCNDPIGMQLLTPYSAMAIANHYAGQGYNIIVILDDLTKHANCYRELMLLSKKPYGRDYYPSDVFYKHSSLLERAYNCEHGSVTVFVLNETIDEELTNYITTNIISITDGQLVFTKDMVKQEVMPPISTKYSVSRVGFSAQTKILNRISTFCSIALSNYYNNLDFYNMYKENCDAKIKHEIYTGLYVLNFLYLYENSTIDYIRQVITVTIIENRFFFDKYDLNSIILPEFKVKMRQVIDCAYEEIIKSEEIMNKLYANVNDLSVLYPIQQVIASVIK